MIIFPNNFVAIERYPGYYWNTAENKLYSIKINGKLKPIKFQRANQWNFYRNGYNVSVNGNKMFLTIDRIKQLVIPVSVVPMQGELF